MSAINIARSLLCFIAGFLLLFTAIPQMIQAQELSEGFEFEWDVTPESMKKDFGPIVLQQKMSDGRYRGVSASASCSECEKYGIDIQLIQAEETRWWLSMSVVDIDRFLLNYEPKRFEITIDTKGREGSTGKGTVIVNVNEIPLFLFPLQTEEEYLPENWIGAAIQRLPQFTEHAISVYVLEGRWSSLITRNMSDEGEVNDRKIVDSLCGVYFKGSDEDCFGKLMEIAVWLRSEETRNPLVKEQTKEIVPTALEIEAAEKILAIVLNIKRWRESRPRYFCLVATQGTHPQLLGMVWANPPETETSADDGVLAVFVGDTLRSTLDSLAPGLYSQLPAILAETTVDTDSAAENEHDLRLIWPIKEP